jgi:hypothetical protein
MVRLEIHQAADKAEIFEHGSDCTFYQQEMIINDV